MTRFTRLAVIALVLIAPVIVAAQGNRQSAAEFRQKLETGLKYHSASELYAALKTAAGGGRQSPPFSQLPDWSGLWTSAGGGSFFDAGPGGIAPKLTPTAAAALKQGTEMETKGISYDENLSQCGPPGFPRWLVIPFLREFIVRPEETWLTSETVNNVRRIYTDNRDHIPEGDRYPLPYGDSIGFWDGQKLVIHTNQIKGAIYTRSHPDYSDETETVEIWQKISPTVIEAKVWVYDPVNLLEPWYVRHTYTKVPNLDKQVRIRYWNCGENQNNVVVQTKEGGSNFANFTFTDKDNKKSNDGRSK